MDIDADGVLSREDVTTFFGRHEYLSAVSGGGAALSSETSVLPKKVIREGVLYPVTPLSEVRLKEVLRDLAQRLFFKKMSLYEFFRLLDANGDGLISIDEWKSNIDKVITLSPLVKDGLFAVIDSARIGVIDYNTFVNVLRTVTVVGGRAIEAAKIQR
jgi:Ca2+-binding EF-hand superfamily protein